MARTTRVGPYRRKDGTMVHGYTRKAATKSSSDKRGRELWSEDPDDNLLLLQNITSLSASDAYKISELPYNRLPNNIKKLVNEEAAEYDAREY